MSLQRGWVLRALCALFVLLQLQGCSLDGPIRIGLIGGFSGRGADVEEDGRNGLILAVEQRNQAGGIHGRTLDIVVQDDGLNAQKALEGIQALVAAKVDAVIGPFNSFVASIVVPVANQAQLAVISPTVSSMDFVGKDDYFFRIGRSTRDNAGDYAVRLYQRGQRRMAVVYSTVNLNFSASWLKEFKAAYEALGGQVVVGIPFNSRIDGTSATVRSMLAAQPDGLLFLASTVDVARLAQQADKLAPGLPKSASEWAASESLIEMGGQAVDGLLTAQLFKRDDSSERFRSFRDSYLARFGREPGFGSVAGYDAATVLILALERQTRGETVKQALLNHGPYEGLQQNIQFDRFGDTARKMFFTEVRAGHFVLLP